MTQPSIPFPICYPLGFIIAKLSNLDSTAHSNKRREKFGNGLIIGCNVGNIWKLLYPAFYKTGNTDGCYNGLVNAMTYIEIASITVGMFGFGFLAYGIGRLHGSRCTITCMLIGSVMFTVSFGVDLTGQFAMFNVFMIIFSLAWWSHSVSGYSCFAGLMITFFSVRDSVGGYR